MIYLFIIDRGWGAKRKFCVCVCVLFRVLFRVLACLVCRVVS
jgi:hypothetical protein